MKPLPVMLAFVEKVWPNCLDEQRQENSYKMTTSKEQFPLLRVVIEEKPFWNFCRKKANRRLNNNSRCAGDICNPIYNFNEHLGCTYKQYRIVYYRGNVYAKISKENSIKEKKEEAKPPQVSERQRQIFR